jgi:hypothetical protein
MLSGKAKLNLLSRSLQFINSRNFGEGYFYSPFLIWCVLYIINSGDQHEQGVTAHGSNNTVEKLIGIVSIFYVGQATNNNTGDFIGIEQYC